MAIPSIPGCRGRVGGFVLDSQSSLNATNCAVKQTLRESDRAIDAAGAAPSTATTAAPPDHAATSELHLDEGQQVRVELILGRADAGQAVRGWDRALDEALDEGKGGVGNLAPAAVDGEGVPAILHSSIAGL
jgi:hypothetical protein